MKIDRLEAIGPRGEACVIVRIEAYEGEPAQRYTYSLAAGDRLRPTDEAGTYETLDGQRRYRLRDTALIAPTDAE